MNHGKWEHNHTLPPCLTRLNGQTYIVPGWTPVPSNIKLSDIVHIKEKVVEPTTHEVIGSKGDKYIVTVYPTRITCNCPAGKFRGKCKHMKEV
mgnify:CR=1 FL=1